MIKLVAIEVFITFVIIAFVLGFLLGFFFMCCFIVSKESDNDDENYF